MDIPVRALLVVWAVLLVGLAIEIAACFLPLHRYGPPLVVAVAVGMLALVGLFFMRLRLASGLARAFAVAAVFWLLVLLGLGSMDPFTRTDYAVPVTRYP